MRLLRTAALVETVPVDGLRCTEPGRAVVDAEVAEAVAAAVRRGQLPPYDLNPQIRLAGTALGLADDGLSGLGLVHVTPARCRPHPGAFVTDLCARAELRRAAAA